MKNVSGISGTTDQRYEHYRLLVDKGQGAIRIDKFLEAKMENVSRNKIQQAAKAGFVLANGLPVKPNYRVRPGDVITVELTWPPLNPELLPEDIPLDILFEDDDLIVINKKPGMVVHPAHGNYTGTLVNALVHHLMADDTALEDGEKVAPRLVHRIDKNTSGLIVAAKNDTAHSRLARQFYYHRIERKYIALVWGDLSKDEGTVTGHIGRDLRNRKSMAVYPGGEHGKPAVTHYRVMERFGYVTLVECRLETGRTHQIRTHMKFIGHPVFNDDVYGGDEILKGTSFAKYRQFIQNCFKILPRQALHAATLGFQHPVTGERLLFQSDIPEDILTVIVRWRNYISGQDLPHRG
ncbi:MAG: RluA family pseudouridine synthase [Bacteroidales bacterium]|nr:RluA family pseudouridine synthase [Bacteroidales bacterium]